MYSGENETIRFRIARHHFPLALLQHFASIKGRFIVPLSKAFLDDTRCYETINPPPTSDKVFHYDPTLGEGVTKAAAQRMKGERHYRVVPCVSREEADSIAARVQNQGGRPACLDMDAV